MPEVSVIMPSYNHEAFIAEAIDSVLAQTFTDLELVIVDDASTDNSPDIIRAYQAKDARVKAAFHDTNLLTSKTINHGFDLAQGRFFCVLTSDDAYPPERIAHQYALAQQPEVQGKVIVGDWVDLDPRGTILPNTVYGPSVAGMELKRHGDIFLNLLEVWTTYISYQTLFFSRAQIADIRFDERIPLIGCEFKFVLDLASRYHFHKMDEVVFAHRIHGENLTHTGDWVSIQLRKDMIVVACDVLDKHAHRLPHSMVVNLQERIVKDALHERTFPTVKKYILDYLAGQPQLLTPLQQALLHQAETDVIFPLVIEGKPPYTLAEVGITKGDIEALHPGMR